MDAFPALPRETWRKPSDDTLDVCATISIVWWSDLGWLEMEAGPGSISPMTHLGWDALKLAGEEG